MSILNVAPGEETDYTIHLRTPKGRGGIGGGGQKNAKEPLKRSKLRQVSPKQRKRTQALQVKLKRMKIVQEMYGYQAHCQICLGRVCKNEVLLAEHVETRNEWDADRFENLGIAGWKCNKAKGSVRTGDYRPEWFKAEMIKLDSGA